MYKRHVNLLNSFYQFLNRQYIQKTAVCIKWYVTERLSFASVPPRAPKVTYQLSPSRERKRESVTYFFKHLLSLIKSSVVTK